MALRKADLELTEVQVDRINEAIAHRLDAFYRDNPDADPPDSMSITFSFVFGLGRSVDVQVGGLEVPVNLD